VTSPPPQPPPVQFDPVALASTRVGEDRTTVLAHRLARRRLLSALLHGRSRSWLDRARVWPAAVVGVLVVVLISAGIGIVAAFVKQRAVDQQQQQQRGIPTATVSPR
jgi:hypothetical protein